MAVECPQRVRHTHAQTDGWTGAYRVDIYTHTVRQTDRQTDRHAHTQTGTERWTDRQMTILLYALAYNWERVFKRCHKIKKMH